MRKKLSIGAVVAAPVILAAALAPAALSHDDGRGTQGFTLTSTFAQDGFADAAPVDESNPGDGYAFSDNVLRGGRAFGDRGGLCTVVRLEPPNGTALCVETYRLPDGQITAEGLLTFDLATGAGSYTLAVTGGTGAYSGVQGEVRTVETNGGVDGTHTFRLTR